MCGDSSKCADKSVGGWTSRQWALGTGTGAGERSSSGCRGLIEGRQRPCHTKGCYSPGNFPTALFPQEPVGTSTVPVTRGYIRHGCFRPVVFNLSVPQIHLEGWLKHRFLPPPHVSDLVGPGEGLRLRISDTSPGDADTTGSKTTP